MDWLDSTFIPDLLQLLRKICQRSNTITTIIPGKISNTKSRLEGPLLLRLTTSTQSQYGITVKALARSKSSIQEVFAVLLCHCIISSAQRYFLLPREIILTEKY